MKPFIPAFIAIVLLSNTLFAQSQKGYCFDCDVDVPRQRLYVVGGTAGTHVYMLKNGVPEYELTLPARGEYHRNCKIVGDHCFVADAKKLLKVFDISKDRPKTVVTDRLANGMGLFVRDDLICLAWGKKGAMLYRFTPPAKLTPLGTSSTGGEAWDVWVKGDYAYFANVDTGLGVVDISEPTSPDLVRTVQWSKEKSIGEIIRGEGDLLAVAAGPQGLYLYDIAKPDAPREVGHFHPDENQCAEGLAIRDGIIYLASGHSGKPDLNGLMILDVRKPGKPKLIGEVPFSDWVEGVCLHENVAYIANTGSGVRAIDISDPTSPEILFPKPGYAPDPAAVTELNDLLKKALSGKSFDDRSSPGRAYVTLVSAIKKRDKDLYYETNPTQGFTFLRYKRKLGDLGPLARDEICGVSEPLQTNACTACAVFIGRNGVARDTQVFALHQEQWVKIVNTGGSVDDSWKKNVDFWFYTMKAACGKPTKKELKALEKYDRLLEKAAAGGKHDNQSSPADAFITLISLSANKKLDRYREVNPGHWKALIESERSLEPPKSSMKIWRVGLQTEKKEGASCPIYMIAGGRLRTVQVLLFCEGKWRKSFNTGPHSGSWEKDLSDDYRKMKDYLSQ